MCIGKGNIVSGNQKTGTKKRLKFILKRMKSIFEKIVKWIDNHAVVITALATIVLAFLTYLYMKETKKQRLVAQQSINLTEKLIEFETSPKPYIKNVEMSWKESESIENMLEGFIYITLANCGRSEAVNIKFHRVLTLGLKKKELPLFVCEYLYPGQEPILLMSPIQIRCNPEEITVFKEIKKHGTDIRFQIPKDKQDPITLEMKLMYDDNEGNTHTVPYHFEYNYTINKWVPWGFGPE